MTALYGRRGRRRQTRRIDQAVREDLAAFGASAEQLARLEELEEADGEEEAPEGPPVEIWAENAAALQLIIALETQWRVAVGPESLVWIGLDYAAVRATAEMLQIEITPQLFGDVREAEHTLRPILNGKA